MLDEKLVEELKAKYGSPLTAIQFPNEAVAVFRKPNRVEYDRFVDATRGRNVQPTTPTREIAKACLVHPQEGVFNEMLDAYPALLCNEILLSIQEMAGHLAEVPVKKL